jgi:hypothetical protein
VEQLPTLARLEPPIGVINLAFPPERVLNERVHYAIPPEAKVIESRDIMKARN